MTGEDYQFKAAVLKNFHYLVADRTTFLDTISEEDSNYVYKNYFVMHNTEDNSLEFLKKYLDNNELNNDKLNKSLFSLGDILNDKISDYEFYLKQLVHYITSALREVFTDDGIIYIPNTSLPEGYNERGKPGLNVQVIKTIDYEELFNTLASILSTGIALSSDIADEYLLIIKTIMSVSDKETKARYAEVLQTNCKNREFSALLVKEQITKISSAVSAIRYIHTLLSDGNTLYMNNSRFLAKTWTYYRKLPESEQSVVKLNVLNTFGSIPIEEYIKIFRRHKHFFIRLKQMKILLPRVVNYISKKSKVINVNAKKNPLNYLGTMDVTNDCLQRSNLTTILRALSYCKNQSSVFLIQEFPSRYRTFKIRNGTIFTKETNLDSITGKDINTFNDRTHKLMDNGKKIISFLRNNYTAMFDYIKTPKGVKIGLPTTAKNFLGSIPNNTIINIDNIFPNNKLVFGIYWEEGVMSYDKKIDYGAPDLDLHANLNSYSINWQNFRTAPGIEFSGDITAAPNGATEYIYVDLNEAEPGIGNIGIKIYSRDFEQAKCKFFIAKAPNEVKGEQDYYSNLSKDDIYFETDLTLVTRDTSIAIFDTIKKQIILTNTNIGSNRFPELDGFTNITSQDTLNTNRADYIRCLYSTINQYTLNDLLTEVFAVYQVPDDVDTSDLNVLDLSDFSTISLELLTSVFMKGLDSKEGS